MDDKRAQEMQRTVRNMRMLLDNEQELEQQKKAPRLLLYASIPAIILVGVVVVWGIPGRSSAPKTDPRVLECTMRTWSELSGARERQIREQNPGITPGEVGARLQAENASIEAAASRQCQKELG